MKNTKKILLATIISALILPMAVSAGNGNGNGYGHGNGHGQGQGGGEGKGRAEMQNTQSKTSDSDEKECEIDLPEMQDLSDYEAERLAYQYSEEMVARDAYNYLYSLYGVQTFQKIASAEQKHMDVVKKLLDRYSLETPAGYGVLQDEFDALKTEGEKGLKEALEVGVKIEILDIDDISETMRKVDNDDILAVYTNIGGASYNHMRGFLKALKNNGFTTDIDYSAYLTEEEANSKGGALKSKLAETLEAEGINLPEMASSKAISEKVEKNGDSHGDMEKNEERGKNSQNMEKKSQNNSGENGEKKGNGKNKNSQNGEGNNGGEENEEKGFFGKIFSVLIFWR